MKIARCMFRPLCFPMLALAGACASSPPHQKAPAPPPAPPPPAPAVQPEPVAVDPGRVVESTDGEDRHLRNIRQLTLDGTRNAEAYFSTDGSHLVFQSIRGEHPHFQVFLMDADGRNVKQLSPGKGKAACPSFVPGQQRVVFSSTHEAESGTDDAAMDIFEADLDGKNVLPLISGTGYDAEASFSRDGKRVLFTSGRDGDLDLYVLDRKSGEARRLTAAPGYDGGGVFSPDGSQVVFRSFRASDGTSDIFIVDVDGANERRLTDFQSITWGPAFHPSGQFIVFSSNLRPDIAAPGQNFDLYKLELATGVVERITYESGHDGLPSFSPDGKHLVWTSGRQGGTSHIFMADWVD